MARGDVFVVGDRVEYRHTYRTPLRYGVVIGFGRNSVVVRFDDNGFEREIKASAAWLRPRPVEPIKGGV